jgi:hypothetical protein
MSNSEAMSWYCGEGISRYGFNFFTQWEDRFRFGVELDQTEGSMFKTIMGPREIID